jgi:hypothetical protein
MAETTRNVFIVVTRCNEGNTEKILGTLREIAPDAIALNGSTFILSHQGGEGFPGDILFALDPLKVETVSVFICTVKGGIGSSFDRETVSAIKAMVNGL